ncbi:adenylosuccinate synthetase [Terriglobus roseus]|nr:adenylosuccinate synthetase [Terriglobus roseus]
MATRLVVLSGPIGVGKSTLTKSLATRFGARIVKTRELLDLEAQHSFKTIHSREEYQAFGEALDLRDGGQWVANAVHELFRREPADFICVDSVRIQAQIDFLRKQYGLAVFHLHMTADIEDLEMRFLERSVTFEEAASYAESQLCETERAVHHLAARADAVVNTSRCNPGDVVVRVATYLKLLSRDHAPSVDLLVGGQFGSEGKGHIASFLAREYQLLIRGGGPNAGHKVYETPSVYTHHQLPCGTRSTTAQLMIAPGAIINPEALLKEIADCGVTPERLSIDPRVMIISREDIRAEELLVKRIGSTGQGVGAAAARRIMGRSEPALLARDVAALKPFIQDTNRLLENAYLHGDRILIEGTQGAGLSLYHGSYPNVTSRDTSASACVSEAGISPKRVRKIVMTCRTYPIRVQNGTEGTSGPLGKELSWSEVAKRSGYSEEELTAAEKTSTTGRQRRVSEFDWVQLRRAALLNGPTDIALTFADYLDRKNTDARRFEQLTDATIKFAEEVENVTGAPVSLISTRFNFRSIIDRRNW